MIPSTFVSSPVPLEAKQPQSIMLPTPCFTVGMVFFGLNVSPTSLQTYFCWLWPKSSILTSSDHKTSFQNSFHRHRREGGGGGWGGYSPKFVKFSTSDLHGRCKRHIVRGIHYVNLTCLGRRRF